MLHETLTTPSACYAQDFRVGRKPHYLLEWRARAGLTQQKLAERISRDKSIVSKLENFKIDYTQELLELLAHAFGVEPADLLRPPEAERRRQEQTEQAIRDLARQLGVPTITPAPPTSPTPIRRRGRAA